MSEQLDVEPARFFVRGPRPAPRHIRPQYACRACETITAAAIPPAVTGWPRAIDGGLAAVGLYVWVLIGKYLDHLPLYRLEQIAARDNVMLSRSTMALGHPVAQWVGRIGVTLQPLADRLAELLLERNVLHADGPRPATPIERICGRTEVMCFRPDHRWWCLITRRAVRDATGWPRAMRRISLPDGGIISWSMISLATRRCLPTA